MVAQMAINKTVNTTRMERSANIARMKTAKRGHKLLKDKSDEMFRNLILLEKQRQALETAVGGDIDEIIRLFLNSRAFMSAIEVDNALSAVRREYDFTASVRNIMGLVVPALKIEIAENAPEVPEFHTTHHDFDRAVTALALVAPKLIDLAAVTKICDMLAAEIKMLRRRINALEHNVIPAFAEIVRYITFKLSENERGNLVRIMKVKEMIAEAEGAPQKSNKSR
jgi:V/A-type H+-transporting ATPase subunit D